VGAANRDPQLAARSSLKREVGTIAIRATGMGEEREIGFDMSLGKDKKHLEKKNLSCAVGGRRPVAN